jgi:hypothetical protein
MVVKKSVGRRKDILFFSRVANEVSRTPTV